MKQTIYIETTIPSHYHDTRSDAESMVIRQWTRDWWDEYRHDYQLVSSFATIEELERGSHPMKAEKLAMIQELPLLEITSEVIDVVEVYIAHKAMPSDPRGDALHLALAAVSKCDILLSWNCRHIVNPRKAEHIEKLNNKMHLHTPRLFTPFELLKMESEDET
ncbi:MAG: type II toxin-antitoxin system VapC family toxin [Verrucomicrobiota bacterium]